MLEELRVENLLLMESAQLRLSPGLNMLTGETGAGKTLLAHALDLLLGGRARRGGIVRAGAEEAYVEGVFTLPAWLARDERLPSGASELTLARRLWPDGRTRAYVCGRSATLADLQELGGRLVSFYGQHEHRKLMLASAQLEVLDDYCGKPQARLRESLRAVHESTRELERRADDLRELAGARERELDLVRFELDEIESADPREDEVEALTAERDRLRNLGALHAAAAGGAEAISPDSGTGVRELLARAAQELEQAGALDPALAALAQRLDALRYEAEDVAAELRGYLEELAAEGGAQARLEQVEERLATLARLVRKHGGGIAGVLAHAERCRARRDQLEHADQSLADVEGRLSAARSELEGLARRLSDARRRAAPKLAAAVRERLAELAMPDVRFEIDLSQRVDGCGPRGADAIEIQIAPNGGETPGPLREIASGGELSRVMLALLSVAHGSGSAGERGSLLVFDEIDAGIGGHTARAVGEHLRTLARGRQLLCITHLPQVAALGGRHFTITKRTGGGPATTTVSLLEGDRVVEELVRMLGASDQDSAASEHARELLRAA